MNDIKQTIKDNHKKGSRGIFEILRKHNTFKRWTFFVALALSLIPSIIIGWVKADSSFAILSSTCELIIIIFPCLLGFSLAGYAIIVGYSNIDLIKAGATPDKHSPYQILSAIFAMSILMQVITTILDFIITFIVRIDINKAFNLRYYAAENYLNLFWLSLVLFVANYSLLLTTYIINNLFSLSQANSLFLTAKKMQEGAQKGKQTNSDKQTELLEQILHTLSEKSGEDTHGDH